MVIEMGAPDYGMVTSKEEAEPIYTGKCTPNRNSLISSEMYSKSLSFTSTSGIMLAREGEI
ncbi:hypothetical protein [Candidatus Hakubella thermalkaliphila]|nr:hypothetical protein [Candidatus Hakubella thermalkaliphila]